MVIIWVEHLELLAPRAWLSRLSLFMMMYRQPEASFCLEKVQSV
jgi:hypothetical protein